MPSGNVGPALGALGHSLAGSTRGAELLGQGAMQRRTEAAGAALAVGAALVSGGALALGAALAVGAALVLAGAMGSTGAALGALVLVVRALATLVSDWVRGDSARSHASASNALTMAQHRPTAADPELRACPPRNAESCSLTTLTARS